MQTKLRVFVKLKGNIVPKNLEPKTIGQLHMVEALLAKQSLFMKEAEPDVCPHCKGAGGWMCYQDHKGGKRKWTPCPCRKLK